MHRAALLLPDEELAAETLFELMREAGLPEQRIANYQEILRQHGLAAVFNRLLDDRVENNLGHHRPPIAWARYAVVAGRHDEALHWLEEAERERQPQVMLINVDPHYLPLRSTPRFQALLERLPIGAGDPPAAD